MTADAPMPYLMYMGLTGYLSATVTCSVRMPSFWFWGHRYYRLCPSFVMWELSIRLWPADRSYDRAKHCFIMWAALFIE
jgi:hypothetical protein